MNPIFHWSNWNVRNKILAPLIVAAILGLTAQLIFEYREARREILATLSLRAIAIGHGIAYSSENVGDLGSVRRILTALSAEQDVVHSFIVDHETKQLVAANRRQMVGKSLSESDIPKSLYTALLDSHDESVHHLEMNGEQQIWVTVPIRLTLRAENQHNESKLGLALMLNPTRVLQQTARDFATEAIVLSTLTVVIVIFCYFIMQSTIITPLQNITSSYANKSSIDEVVLLPETRDDEIGQLSKVLNNLVKMVRDNNAKIEANQLQLAKSAKFSSLGEMAGGVAHEINNPLAILKGHLSQVSSKIRSGALNGEEAGNRLLKLETIVDRMASIVKGLRTFARDGDKDPMQPAEVKAIIDETLALARMRLHNNNIELREDFDRAAAISARSVQISQVVLNLLNNSFDAVINTENAWIKISTALQGNHVLIRIQDSGKGIPQDVVQKLMQPFFTTKPVGKGTGIGLSISKGIAEDHNGELNYELYEGHTSFVLRLPVVA